MIIVNREKLQKLNEQKENEVYILTDFDGTITCAGGDSSWASIFKNPKVSKEFVNECINIYTHYHKYEIDTELDKMRKSEIMDEWYHKNIETLKHFKITKDIIDFAANNESVMKFREGARDFLRKMYEKSIPLIVISGGVGNIIEDFLKQNDCLFENIYIASNNLKYDANGVVCGVRTGNLIHPLNKNEVFLPDEIKEKISGKQAILLGNSTLDIDMLAASENAFKIGFLEENVEEQKEEFEKSFDLVATEETSFKTLEEYIELFK